MSKIEIINGKLMMHERDLKQISLDFIEKNLCLIFLKKFFYRTQLQIANTDAQA